MLSKKKYPFKVAAFLPKGHQFGNKKRESIRYTFHRTLESANMEAAIKYGQTSSKVIDRNG